MSRVITFGGEEAPMMATMSIPHPEPTPESEPLVKLAPGTDWQELLEDSPEGEWTGDPLQGCSRRTLPLGEDDEGPVSATLVRYDGELNESLTSEERSPVLHIHGWSDYFYNLPMARSWAAQGRPFYALDLRKYGRSLRSWQTPGYIDDLSTYDDDIDAALALIAEEHPHAAAPIVHGHSTGGLITALWAHRHPGRAGALILNSPWLEMPGDAAARTALEGILTPLNHLSPKRPLKVPNIDTYWQSLSDEAHGEWTLHPKWRPRESFPLRAGWLKAVLTGHRRVSDGLDLELPVLVLLSAATVYKRQWSDELKESDAVLDVELLARRSMKLGPHVTVVRLQGAIHDVFASEEPVRSSAFGEVVRWLRAYAPEYLAEPASREVPEPGMPGTEPA